MADEAGTAGSPAGPDADARTLRRLVADAEAVLTAAGVPSPRVDALALAEHALGTDRLVLVLPPPLPAGFEESYAALVERRRRREPLQHITGTAAFRHLTLAVGPGVFVPRPETESVAEEAVAEARRIVAAGASPLVVDLCAGSGAIALAVAQEVPGAEVVALELSPVALDAIRRNAQRNGVTVRIVAGDVSGGEVLADLDGRVHVVVSNPPYIPPDAVPVDPEVRDHDPGLALYGGGPDGLEVPRAVVRAAERLLRPGGLFVMEHAEVQAAAARDLAAAAGLVDVRTAGDLAGRDRMVVARRP